MINLDFDTYQKKAHKTAIYPELPAITADNQMQRINVPLYPFLKLSGESGEIIEKIGKVIRDQNSYLPENETINLEYPTYRISVEKIIKELGDELWYMAEICTRLGITFDWIAITNLEKLAKRAKENKIKGSGDNR